MAYPKNSPEILALSYDAQAILAGHWMLGRNSTITIQNQKSHLSERGEAAMAELIGAEIVSEENANDGFPESRTYRLTDAGRAMEFRKPLSWINQHGRFSLVTPTT